MTSVHTYHNHRVLTQMKNHKMEKKSSNITIQIYINRPDIKKCMQIRIEMRQNDLQIVFAASLQQFVHIALPEEPSFFFAPLLGSLTQLFAHLQVLFVIP